MWYRNPGKLIRELFPEQTKNIATTILWSCIYILDIVFVVWLASVLGISLLYLRPQLRTLAILLFALLAFALFYAEAKVWNAITSKIKK